MSRVLLAVLLVLGGAAPLLSASGWTTVFRAATAAVGSEWVPEGAPRPTSGSANDPSDGPQTDVGSDNDPNG